MRMASESLPSEPCFAERCSNSAQVSVNAQSPLQRGYSPLFPARAEVPSLALEGMPDTSGLCSPGDGYARLPRLHPTAGQPLSQAGQPASPHRMLGS